MNIATGRGMNLLVCGQVGKLCGDVGGWNLAVCGHVGKCWRDVKIKQGMIGGPFCGKRD